MTIASSPSHRYAHNGWHLLSQSNSIVQAKWMGLRVMAQGLTFGGLFGFAIYSGRLFSTPEHPLLKANKV